MSRNEIFIPYLMSKNPDPFNISWSGDFAACVHAWTTLVQYSADGTILPSIAESWTQSQDGLTWRFRIKPNLRWSDGSEMTLDQLIASLQASALGTSHSNFSAAISAIAAKGPEIEFSLNRAVPAFLINLTYVDWAIVHPDSFEIKDRKARLINFVPCSGPYCLEIPTDAATTDTIGLVQNSYYHSNDSALPHTGALQYYTDCSEIVSNAEKILSFRSYSESMLPTCRKVLEESGFQIARTHPTWILKADFLARGQKRFTLPQRLKMFVKIHELLDREDAGFGVSRSTGIRPLNSVGALSEVDFLNLLNELTLETSPVNLQGIEIDLVTMEAWSHWKSYDWLKKALKAIGVTVREHILSRSDFATARGDGSLGEKHDLVFIPLGAGDPDPDATWQIASRHLYPGEISNERLSTAYFESDPIQRQKIYDQLAIDLIRKGLTLTLRNDADFVGIHKSAKSTKAPPFRQGLTLYDLVF